MTVTLRSTNYAVDMPDTEYPYKDEIEYFTEGECIQLAYEIHKRTGWNIAQVMSIDPKFNPKFYHCHVFVIHPDGEAVDIRGKMPLAGLKELWPGCPYFLPYEDVYHFMGEAKKWKELSFPLGEDEFAKHWANMILEMIQ